MPVISMMSGKRRVYLIEAKDPRAGNGNQKTGHSLFAYALMEDGKLKIYPSHSEVTPPTRMDTIHFGGRVITPLTRNAWLDPLYRAAFVAELLDVILWPELGDWRKIESLIVSPEVMARLDRSEETKLRAELENVLSARTKLTATPKQQGPPPDSGESDDV